MLFFPTTVSQRLRSFLSVACWRSKESDYSVITDWFSTVLLNFHFKCTEFKIQFSWYDGWSNRWNPSMEACKQARKQASSSLRVWRHGDKCFNLLLSRMWMKLHILNVIMLVILILHLCYLPYLHILVIIQLFLHMFGQNYSFCNYVCIL
jgi:hypothetical protein